MPLSPPEKSTGLFSDMRHFLLHRPSIPTSIVATSHGEREDYTHRIRQRIGVCVADYSVLNIHRIGIEEFLKADDMTMKRMREAVGLAIASPQFQNY